MSGITRIKINYDWSDWRTQLADAHYEVANRIYRDIFNLEDGNESINVTKSEALARYDWKEGIDVILTTESGSRMTVQEKFLTYYKSTITFEETKTSGEKGAWYYCTAQYYFVGYTRKYWNYKTRSLFDSPTINFQDYVLIDLASIHREDEKGNIKWTFNKNINDGRGSTFKYLLFDELPINCIISRLDTYS